MLPSKSMMEYMTEMQRLFPRPEAEDSPTPFPFSSDQSSLQSVFVNRSFSSTDSTSPESYPDLSLRSNIPPWNSRSHETSFTARPQRAIVGRKILGKSQQNIRLMSPGDRVERDNFWGHEEIQLSATPPRSIYELFPSEDKAFEFKTPIKSESKIYNSSPTFSNRSPFSSSSSVNRNLSNISPVSYQSYRSQNFNQSIPAPLLSPTWSNTSLGSTVPSQRHYGFMNNSLNNYAPKYQAHGPGSSIDETTPSKLCTFCRKNGETPIVYMTHSVKEQVGGKNVVTCPILRSHLCSTCGASGDNAHTMTYCPVLRSHNNGKPLQSTTVTLKNTRIKSNGRRRF